jgi:antitoxin ParD1/3/4
MNVSVGERWEDFIDAIVKEGRYASASEVVREGLRMVEEREQKLATLRTTIQAAIDDPIRLSHDHVWNGVMARHQKAKNPRSAA